MSEKILALFAALLFAVIFLAHWEIRKQEVKIEELKKHRALFDDAMEMYRKQIREYEDLAMRATRLAEGAHKRWDDDKAYMISNNNNVVLNLVTNAIKWRSNCVVLLKVSNPDHPLIAEATEDSGTKDRPESFNLRLRTSPRSETNHIEHSIIYRSK